MRRSVFLPPAGIGWWSIPALANRQYQPFLGAGDADKISATLGILFSPEGLVFDTENNDRIEFESFALVNGQEADGLIVGETRQSLGQIRFQLQQFVNVPLGVIDDLFEPRSRLVIR